MSGPIRPPLTVETVDGLTSGRPITKIKVSNGDLTISGNTATIDTTGSGGVPGGSDTEIQFNNAGAFGGDAGLKITTKGGGGTTTIRSGNMLLGGGKVAAATANGFVSLISDGSGQIFLTSGSDQGGTFTDTQVNIFSNSNTDNAILNFRDSSNIENGRITLKDDGNLEIKNSVSGKNVFLEVAGSAGVTVKQATTDTDVQLTIEGNGTGTPKLSLTNNTKAVTVLCDTNQKLKVEGGTDSFVFDVSSASGGITFPDGTTQTTAASGVSFPLTAPDGSKTAPSYSFSNDTDTGMFLVSAGILGIAVGGDREIRFKQDELQFDGGGGSQYKLTTDGANTNIIIQPNTGEASIEVEAGGGSQNVKISGANGGTVSFNGNYNFPVSDGSANQVLQTDGAGSLSFADASGGGGSTTFGRGSVSNTALGTSVSTFGTTFADLSTGDRAVSDYNTPGAFPLVAQEKGDVASFTMRVTQASAGDNVLVGFYNSTNGLPSTLMGSCSIPTDSTGYITQTTFSTTISLDAGETYWLVYGNDDNSTSANVRRLTSTSSFGIVETDSQEYPFSGYAHSGTATSLPATFSPTAGRFFRPLAYYTVS